MVKVIFKAAVLFLLSFVIVPVSGQTLRDEIRDDIYKAGGVYYHYTCDTPDHASVPQGYEPFYISHYGRHGSRWLAKESDYSDIKEMLDSAAAAGILTPLGEDVYSRVKTIYEDAAGRAGALTPLGVRQHKDIAGRMIDAFPQVFEGEARINASATTYPRCILSMTAFCERLKEENPSLQIEKAADLRTTRILNFFHNEANPEICDDFRKFVQGGQWQEDYRNMAPVYVKTDRLMSSLFTDGGAFAGDRAVDFVHGLYRLAADVQSTELDGKVTLFDVFTLEELYLQVIYDNYYFFVLDGPSAVNKGASAYYARILLEDIISRADEAIGGNGISADLRFGHDSSILPLMTLLQFREFRFDSEETDPALVAENWSLHELTPMAANIQFIFYRPVSSSCTQPAGKGPDSVLVKVMHNEREMHLPVREYSWPYYRWSDVKDFYLSYISSLSYPESGIGD